MPTRRRWVRCSPFWVLPGLALFALGATPQRGSEPVHYDFVHDVLPVFKARCANCHLNGEARGGLALDSLASLKRGGASGSILATKGSESLLMDRLLGKRGLPSMPMGFQTLDERELSKIRSWIDDGAPETVPGRGTHWAFVPPKRPALPAKSANPIDAFVRAHLAQQGLQMSPLADRRTLIKRVTLDLIGLPPSPQEVEAFVKDRRPDAYEKVVDRLLANPHYGERMALPWLDAARYADSNGFQQDGDTYQYVWRDWVIKALNANMRFDTFTREQLAGDLLPQPTLDQLVATGFNRNHMLNGEGGAIPEEQRCVNLFDRVDTTSIVWLGLTMGCARCHDHKYDPISQRDYYSMLAFFNNVPETGVPSGSGQYRIAEPWVFAGSPDQMRRLSALTQEIKAHPEAKDQLQKAVDALKAEIPRVMVMSDKQPRETHVFVRGNYEVQGDVVMPSTPQVFPKSPVQKNRLDLANWILDARNPLTARVQVNRMWQLFFGRGLVKTPENFGVQSEAPAYLDLLDWLAVEFRESGWNVKRLQKLIVMSETYRQSSKVTPSLKMRDPDNQWLARGARFRMPSLILRDMALSEAGLLNRKMYGKPVYPYQPFGIWDGLNITLERNFDYPQSKGADNYRRSIYTFWRRTVAPGNMFDASTRNVCTVNMSQTSTPLHALTLLNDVTWVEAGRGLALRAFGETKNLDKALDRAFLIVTCREPGPQERPILRRSFERALRIFKADPAAAKAFLNQGFAEKSAPGIEETELAALATTCQAMMNLDEAMTRE